MAFELAETVVDEIISILKAELESEVRAFYISEKSLTSVPQYPAIFVLCPSFDVDRWMPDMLDVDYTVVIGCMIMHQDTEEIRRQLYRLVQKIMRVMLEAEPNASFTYKAQSNFTANFGPMFTSGSESFIADAQVTIPVVKKMIEFMEN